MGKKLYFKYGTMNSGKSMFLLATANNFEERGVPFLCLKSGVDTRDGDGIIYSRVIPQRACQIVSPETNIYSMICYHLADAQVRSEERLQWILVDEAQFLTPEQVDDLARICDDLDIAVLCYGLRTDFQTKLFPGSRRLFELADSMEEIKSTCHCGNKNSVNARINEKGEVVLDGEQVLIGGEDRYVAMCRKCYNKRKQFTKENPKLF